MKLPFLALTHALAVPQAPVDTQLRGLIERMLQEGQPAFATERRSGRMPPILLLS